MSRIGRLPIPIPSGVEVNISGNHISVKGPKGTLKYDIPAQIHIKKEKDHLVCDMGDSKERQTRCLFGLARSLVNNMVIGVTKGYTRELEIVGTGYKAKQDAPNKITVTVGYSHPVVVESPADVSLKVEGNGQRIIVHGINKQVVGQIATDLRGIKPPEPYKGTGIRFVGEKIKMKEGKKLAA